MRSRWNAIDGHPTTRIYLVHQYKIYKVSKVMLVHKGLIKTGNVCKPIQHFRYQQQGQAY